MDLINRLLNTRFWLMAMGALLSAFTIIGFATGAIVTGAQDFWSEPLSESEMNIAIVVELAWNAHILGMGIILLALGLLAANPVRARIGAIAVVAVMGSQFLAAGASAAYGYGGFNGLNLVALAIMIVPLITLIACLTKLTAR